MTYLILNMTYLINVVHSNVNNVFHREKFEKYRNTKLL